MTDLQQAYRVYREARRGHTAAIKMAARDYRLGIADVEEALKRADAEDRRQTKRAA